MTTPARRPRPGVTILEVLVALAILFIALAALSQLVDFGTDRAVEAQIQARGSRLAQSKMAEIEAGVDVPDAGEFAEEPGWSWAVTREPAGPGAVPLNLVTVKVTRTITGQTHTVSLSQHVLAPASVSSAAPAEVAQPATSSAPSAGGSQ